MSRISSLVRGGAIALTALFLHGCSGGGAAPGDPGDPGGPPGGSFGDLTLSGQVSSSPPANVSILFEATDSRGEPVANLLSEGSIDLFENGQRVSPFESRQRIQPIGRQVAFPTLLLLDLSGSIVRSGNLPQLKASAKQFVETLLDPQSPNAQAREIAVAFFPGSSTGRGIRMVSDYATDITAIQADIDAIRGAPDTTTNLHEAILRGFESLDARQADLVAQTEVELTEGSLAVFTDGTDRAGTVGEQEVLDAIDATDNRVFTIGLQGEIDEAVLRRFGKTGFALVDDINNLRQVFQQVANTIRAAANRFYAVEYCSPKRNGEHELTVVAQIGDSRGSTTARFDANAFRAGCRVPEGALELSGPDDVTLDALAFDTADGSILACGSLRGTAQWFGRGRTAATGTDAFVTRVLPPTDDGRGADEAYTLVLQSGASAQARAVAADGSGAGYVGGSFSRDLAIAGVALAGNGDAETGFVAKLAESGAPLWARRFHGAGVQRVVDVAVRGDGVLVLGEFDGTVGLDGNSATSQGGFDLFVAEFDAATGTCRWLRGDGGAEDDRPQALAVAADGRFATCGRFTGSTSLAGNAITSAGGEDGFVVCWEVGGAPRFARGIGGAGADTATDLLFDLDGRVAVAGSFDAPFTLDGTSVQLSGPARNGLLLRLGAASGALANHTVLGDASGGLATRTSDLVEDGIGNLYVAWSMSAANQPETTMLGFAMIPPSGERLLDYSYATDARGTPHMTLGPFGIDQGAFCGPFSRSASFGPFPLRFAEPPAPGAPLGGVNAFLGFIGPRS